MNALTTLAGRAAIVILAVIALQQIASYAMSQGMHTLIASEPPAVKPDATPIVEWSSCNLTTLDDMNRPARPCEVVRPQPVLPQKSSLDIGMKLGDSEKVTAWFLVAEFALPLTFGGAILGLWWIARRP